MRKLFLVTSIAVCSISTSVSAQSSNTPIRIETVTSLPPKDGIPLKFESAEALNNYVPARIAELKKLIVEVQHDATKASYYREELWRAENAIVEPK
jgi:hypothetical protein